MIFLVNNIYIGFPTVGTSSKVGTSNRQVAKYIDAEGETPGNICPNAIYRGDFGTLAIEPSIIFALESSASIYIL